MPVTEADAGQTAVVADAVSETAAQAQAIVESAAEPVGEAASIPEPVAAPVAEPATTPLATALAMAAPEAAPAAEVAPAAELAGVAEVVEATPVAEVAEVAAPVAEVVAPVAEPVPAAEPVAEVQPDPEHLEAAQDAEVEAETGANQFDLPSQADIRVAAEVHEQCSAALDAVGDVRIGCGAVERVDAAVLQCLGSLVISLRESSRQLEFVDRTEPFDAAVALLGFGDLFGSD